MKIEGLSILLIVVILSSSVLALTGSIGNPKAILNIEVGFFGTTIERTVLVKNVNDVAVNIKLEASEEFKDITKIIDNEFTLQPGEDKKARFNINIKKPGDYEGKIVVFFKGEEEKTGVALASTIIIHAVKKGSLDEEESEDEEIVNENNTSDITGNVVSENKTNAPVIAVLISTLILAAILIFLIFKVKTKKAEKIGEKVNKKRADRSS